MANIRVDALTEVATIADDDVVMVDGKQGVRATTWGTLKNLIKQQCGINELNTNKIQIRSGWLTGLTISASKNSSFRVNFDPFPHNCVIVIPIVRGGIYFPAWIDLMENGWAEIAAISTNGSTLDGRNIQWIAIGA